MNDSLLIKLLEANGVTFRQIKDALGDITAILADVRDNQRVLISFFQSDRMDLIERLEPDVEVNIDEIRPESLPSLTGVREFDYSPLFRRLMADTEEHTAETVASTHQFTKEQMQERLQDIDAAKPSVARFIDRLEESGYAYEHRPFILGFFPLAKVSFGQLEYVIFREGNLTGDKASLFSKYGYKCAVVTDDELNGGDYVGVLSILKDVERSSVRVQMRTLKKALKQRGVKFGYATSDGKRIALVFRGTKRVIATSVKRLDKLREYWEAKGYAVKSRKEFGTVDEAVDFATGKDLDWRTRASRLFS